MLLKNLQPYQKLILFLLIFGSTSILLFLLLKPKQKPQPQPTPPPAKLVLETNQSSLTLNQELIVSVKIQNLSQTINTITANLSYPADLLKVSAIESADSPFEVWFEQQILPELNLIRLTASAKPPGINQDTTFVKIIFRPKAKGVGEIRFEETSSIFRQEDAINILGETQSLPLLIQ